MPELRPALDIAPFVRVSFQQRIEQSFGDSEVGLPKPLNRLREVRQSVLGRKLENAQRAGYTESLAARATITPLRSSMSSMSA